MKKFLYVLLGVINFFLLVLLVGYLCAQFIAPFLGNVASFGISMLGGALGIFAYYWLTER